MWKKNIYLLLFFLFLCVLPGCESEFTPDLPPTASQVVVEGYIEAGENATPPYLFLTKNVPFFKELKLEDIDNNFVHNAIVNVSDGTKNYALTEVCLNDLTADQKKLAANFLGFSADSIKVNLCIYLDITNQLKGQIGKTYTLTIKTTDNQIINAATTIPTHVPIDSIKFLKPAGKNPPDTLAQLQCFIKDRPNVRDFYRYLTATQGRELIAANNSTFDDRFFDGKNFWFQLNKAEYPLKKGETYDPLTYGLFLRKDTIKLKWICYDKAHYDFWNTIENASAGQGPFSSYSRITSNIQGGLGVWGGSSVSYYTEIVPKK